MVTRVDINGVEYNVSSNWSYGLTFPNLVGIADKVLLKMINTLGTDDLMICTKASILIQIDTNEFAEIFMTDNGFNCVGTVQSFFNHDSLKNNVYIVEVPIITGLEFLRKWYLVENLVIDIDADLPTNLKNKLNVYSIVTNHLLSSHASHRELSNNRAFSKPASEGLPLSRFWDHMSTLDELLEDVPWVFVDFSFKRHNTDDCVDGIAMYIMQKDEDEKLKEMPSLNKSDYIKFNYTEIGISTDGFTYNGDVSFSTEHFKMLVKVPTKKAIDILLDWGELQYKREEFALKIYKYSGDRNCVNLFLSSHYAAENRG